MPNALGYINFQHTRRVGLRRLNDDLMIARNRRVYCMQDIDDILLACGTPRYNQCKCFAHQVARNYWRAVKYAIYTSRDAKSSVPTSIKRDTSDDRNR